MSVSGEGTEDGREKLVWTERWGEDDRHGDRDGLGLSEECRGIESAVTLEELVKGTCCRVDDLPLSPVPASVNGEARHSSDDDWLFEEVAERGWESA